ncbi:MAG TPA: CoA pyrophosphatase [Blastocatellia bacterium]|nr:CoA pyrophosphatase [Blastocatellia bacterium]
MTELDAITQMLPGRLKPRDNIQIDSNLRQAAVALILRNHADLAEILMIKRAPNPNDYWSGHLALPGGRKQADDKDLLNTATRETFEEVGINLADGGKVLGRLDIITPRSQRVPTISVTPFVAIAPPEYHSFSDQVEERELNINHEVAAAFWIPVRFLKKEGRSDTVSHIVEDHKYEWMAYPSVYGPIWGLTERILTQFLSLVD